MDLVAPLAREGLVSDHWEMTEERPLHDVGQAHPLAFSLRIYPTSLGAELFVWGSGSRAPGARALFSEGDMAGFLPEIPETPCASLLSESYELTRPAHPHPNAERVARGTAWPRAILR